MSISARALAGTLLLTGALSLATTGTAHATTGSFSCGLASYNAGNGSVTGPLCTGGPIDATSGFITSTGPIAPGEYHCDRLSATPMGSFFAAVNGFGCVLI